MQAYVWRDSRNKLYMREADQTPGGPVLCVDVQGRAPAAVPPVMAFHTYGGKIPGKPVHSWLVDPLVLVCMGTTEPYQESTHAANLPEIS